MIEVRRLSHNFGPHWALKDCSFHLKKGEFLFLSGPSGAGKTTLLRLLFAGLPIQRGEVSVAGFDLGGIKNAQVPLLRRQVSVVFQDFKILPERSVYENVILPLQVRGLGKTHSDRRVRAVVRALGLEKRINLMCGELSGGEQQRVAVARAFVVNPQVLLADEPTGNLDPDLSYRLMDLFKQFQAYGTTMIVATHSQELMKRHPEARMIRLEEGMITAANWPGASLYPGLEDGLGYTGGAGSGGKAVAGPGMGPGAGHAAAALSGWSADSAASGDSPAMPNSLGSFGSPAVFDASVMPELLNTPVDASGAPNAPGASEAFNAQRPHGRFEARGNEPSAPGTYGSDNAPARRQPGRLPVTERSSAQAALRPHPGRLVAGAHGESPRPVTSPSDRELLRGASGTQASGQRTMYQGPLKGPQK